ncbi:SGNH/GDSL hydrolase family protein [Streptomyces sp. TS71-3]|uniref:SGNH/GDSL hydrolase family protein n=1 Tax=Streptomyces sp. TS71-3 TaxID=2733862 RepID=UPI001B099502|nr:SGNH/GDSL hydrolase family protein [Streptomyces sp. TS71-3]GHJ36564.1 SGNH hydrolase [Streptomyces sp. TS71-3]
MTKRHDGGPGPLSPARYGALLAALVAVIVVVSTAIYVGTSRSDGSGRDTLADSHPSRGGAAAASVDTWVSAWSTAPSGAEPGTELTGLAGRSVRNVVHTTAGGTHARITLSNLYGQQPLTITHASLAVAAAPGTPAAAFGTLRRLTFGGASSVVIPAGEQTLSDPVRLHVTPGSDLLVSTYSPTESGPVTYHAHARQISYVAEGDRTEDTSGSSYTQQVPFWRYVTALDVLSGDADGTVVVVGDSLTDGITSTTGANHRWTDVLADRLRTETGAPRFSVANEGISGNRILTDGPGRPPVNLSGLARFQRDALGRAGVKAVVIALGVNDILHDQPYANAGRIVDGLRELVRQAHGRGLRVVGATLMPFGGHVGYQRRLEGIRETVNQQIRAGRVFDHVVDFDAALRDPYAPRRLRPEYDSGDHLHPSDAGYRKMAESFNLSDLKSAAAASL